jgi:hypothetical protein
MKTNNWAIVWLGGIIENVTGHPIVAMLCFLIAIFWAIIEFKN